MYFSSPVTIRWKKTPEEFHKWFFLAVFRSIHAHQFFALLNLFHGFQTCFQAARLSHIQLLRELFLSLSVIPIDQFLQFGIFKLFRWSSTLFVSQVEIATFESSKAPFALCLGQSMLTVSLHQQTMTFNCTFPQMKEGS